MKKEIIAELFQKFECTRHENDGVEFWSARDVQDILGYSDWRNFLNIIDKAVEACENVEIDSNLHFVDVTKMVDLGSGSKREIDDKLLTRYACYLIAQNGDPRKEQIAFAQSYFALQTRKQELIEKRLLDIARVNAREKLSKSEKKLSGIMYERGIDDKGFAVIRSKGDKALFGGFSTNEMKYRLGTPENRPLADFLPTLTIKAKDFATELTSHNLVDKSITGEGPITQEHVDNNKAVRKILIERGVTPENLPPDEDIKKVQRQIESADKKLLKDSKKTKRLDDIN